MKNKFILTLLFALTSCKYPFALDYMDAKPMIAIRSYICADSVVTININKAIPLSKLATVDTNLENPSFLLKCNGMNVDVKEEMVDKGGLVLYADAFKCGDSIEISVESDETEQVVANTIIPDMFPHYELELTIGNYSDRNLKIRYNDNSGTTDWYGAIVNWSGIMVSDLDQNGLQYTDVTNHNVFPPSGYNEIQIEPISRYPVAVLFNGDYLYIWRDSDEDDNEYELNFNYYTRQGNYIIDVMETEIQCTLFKLSEDMYRYLLAQFDRQNNPFKDAGLSSPSFTYSNVKNGVGYFCGYSTVQSDWIKDTLLE